MPEMTKEELNEELNKLLGTSIDFVKLSKGDLVVLHEALIRFKESQGFPLPLLDRPLGDIINEKVANRPLRELTLADILGLSKERKGLLGLGIIPRIIGRVEEKKSEPKT
jgi:hypothetical protein